MQQLQQLKAFDSAGGQTVEEMVALLAFAQSMEGIYLNFGEIPEWLKDKIVELEQAISSAFRDEMARQLRETEAQLEALKSRDEKREDLRAKQERLKAKLSGPQKAAA